MKALKILKRKYNEMLCSVFGHKECWVLTWRTRTTRKNASWKNCKTHEVRGIYTECSRCGKKLSNFRRL